MIGVITVIKTDDSSVWSRIATGLITGSFVGFVNTMVSYYHQRREYFMKLGENLLDITYELMKDYTMSKLEIEHIEESTKEEIRAENKGKGKTLIKRATEFKAKYDKLSNNVDLDSFVPLLPDPQMENLIDEIYNILKVKLNNLYTDYISGTMVAAEGDNPADDDTTEMDEDTSAMFNYAIQAKYDLRDQIAYELDEIGNIAARLNATLGNDGLETLKSILEMSTSLCEISIEGVELRNPMDEGIKILEKELNEDAE